MTHLPNCYCDICRHHHPIELPDHLVDAVKKRSVVIFAGAGISTENRTVYPWTLYEEVCMAIGLHPKDGPAFPEAMERFCDRPDGRRILAELITGRFQYLHDFPELYHTCSRFHRELSTVWQISDIITTNWDDLFERECGAVPLVTDADFALWTMSGRKVLKIHGSSD